MWRVEKQGNAFGLYENDIFHGRLYGEQDTCQEIVRKLNLVSFPDEGMIQGRFHLTATQCVVSLLSAEQQHVLWEHVDFKTPQQLDVLLSLGNNVLKYLVRVLRIESQS